MWRTIGVLQLSLYCYCYQRLSQMSERIVSADGGHFVHMM